MTALIVMACSSTKRPGEEAMPAIDRYDGPMWRTLRAALAELGGGGVKLGLGARDQRDTPAQRQHGRRGAVLSEEVGGGGEHRFALFQHRHQSTHPGRFDILDQQLVF